MASPEQHPNRNGWGRIVKFAFVVIALVYPLIIYWGHDHLSPLTLAALVSSLLLVRGLIDIRHNPLAWVWLVFAAVMMGATWLVGNHHALQWYPVLMNATMLGVFAYSLYYPPTVIERLARLSTPNLPDSAIDYTRKVTWVWCGFFLINGTIAAWLTLFASLSSWTLYNSLISYLLMGVLFAVEFMVRQWHKKRAHTP